MGDTEKLLGQAAEAKEDARITRATLDSVRENDERLLSTPEPYETHGKCIEHTVKCWNRPLIGTSFKVKHLALLIVATVVAGPFAYVAIKNKNNSSSGSGYSISATGNSTQTIIDGHNDTAAFMPEANIDISGGSADETVEGFYSFSANPYTSGASASIAGPGNFSAVLNATHPSIKWAYNHSSPEAAADATRSFSVVDYTGNLTATMGAYFAQEGHAASNEIFGEINLLETPAPGPVPPAPVVISGGETLTTEDGQSVALVGNLAATGNSSLATTGMFDFIYTEQATGASCNVVAEGTTYTVNADNPALPVNVTGVDLPTAVSQSQGVTSACTGNGTLALHYQMFQADTGLLSNTITSQQTNIEPPAPGPVPPVPVIITGGETVTTENGQSVALMDNLQATGNTTLASIAMFNYGFTGLSAGASCVINAQGQAPQTINATAPALPVNVTGADLPSAVTEAQGVTSVCTGNATLAASLQILQPDSGMISNTLTGQQTNVAPPAPPAPTCVSFTTETSAPVEIVRRGVAAAVAPDLVLSLTGDPTTPVIPSVDVSGASLECPTGFTGSTNACQGAAIAASEAQTLFNGLTVRSAVGTGQTAPIFVSIAQDGCPEPALASTHTASFQGTFLAQALRGAEKASTVEHAYA